MPRKLHRWTEVEKRLLTPAELKEVDRRAAQTLLEMALKDLRKEAGTTQKSLARRAKMTQSELSRLENRADHRISTLRRYVEALGGELRIVAVMNRKEIVLQGV